MFYVCAYLTVVGYFGLAAISPAATTVPNTWSELARLGVLAAVSYTSAWLGGWVRPRLVAVVVQPRQDDEATS